MVLRDSVIVSSRGMDETVGTPMDVLEILAGPEIEIPLHEVDEAGPILLIEEEPDRLAALIASAVEYYGDRPLDIGDKLSHWWLARAENPYLPEIASVADLAAPRGAYVLNMSYEWACTVGLGPDPSGHGNRMLRTLDWPLRGLGRTVVVARQKGEAGYFYNITWPGFVGVITAMAPGRFSAAINQPPLRKVTGLRAVDWAMERLRMVTSTDLPPSHLLRRTFETCHNYLEAQDLLATMPVSMPAFISLSGVEPGQCCVVERTEFGTIVHDGPGAIANHWLERPDDGYPRGYDSVGRHGTMDRLRQEESPDLSWVAPPILNSTTRLAVVANAATGLLRVRGLEADGHATKVFELGA